MENTCLLVCFTDSITVHNNTSMRCAVSSGNTHFLLCSGINIMIDSHTCNVRSLKKRLCCLRLDIVCKMISEKKFKDINRTFLNSSVNVSL